VAELCVGCELPAAAFVLPPVVFLVAGAFLAAGGGLLLVGEAGAAACGVDAGG
jgi:hypothetical protein